MFLFGGRALNGLGGSDSYQTQPNSEYQKAKYSRQTAGDNVRRQKGNNPNHHLRSPSHHSVGKEVDRPRQLGGWLRSSHPLKKA